MSEDRSGSDIFGYNMTKFDGSKEALVLLNFSAATQDFAAAEHKGWKKPIEDTVADSIMEIGVELKPYRGVI